MAFFTSCKQSQGGQRVLYVCISLTEVDAACCSFTSHLVFTQFRVGPLDAFLLEPHGEEVRVGHHDTHEARLKRSGGKGRLTHAGAENQGFKYLYGSYLQAFAVDKYLGHGVAQSVHGLNLLRRNVFPLCQLEDVLLPVCDLQSAVLKQYRNNQSATSLLPAAGVHCQPSASRALLTGSHFPTSPVCSQPSLSRASAVLSGSFR